MDQVLFRFSLSLSPNHLSKSLWIENGDDGEEIVSSSFFLSKMFSEHWMRWRFLLTVSQSVACNLVVSQYREAIYCLLIFNLLHYYPQWAIAYWNYIFQMWQKLIVFGVIRTYSSNLSKRKCSKKIFLIRENIFFYLWKFSLLSKSFLYRLFLHFFPLRQ